MVSDAKSSTSLTSSPPPQLHPELDDFPPSYDSATAHPETSTSTTSELPRQPPKDTLYLFEGPPQSEPLLGRANTPLDVLNSIETYRKGAWLYSSDHRLQNPTTLYDFIRHSTLSHPSLKIQCTGIHFETPERDELVQDRDGPRQRKKGQVERIVDFDFTVDLTPILAHPDNYANVHLVTVDPDMARARGSGVHGHSYAATFAPPNARVTGAAAYEQIDHASTDPGRLATKQEDAEEKRWADWRENKGLPLWVKRNDWKEYLESEMGKGKGKATGPVALGDLGDEEALVSGRDNAEGSVLEADAKKAGLMDWCERYCADPGWMKEFVVPVNIWGWNKEALISAIKGAITSTGYQSNNLSVTITPEIQGLVVIPHNLLSRAINKTIIYTLLWLTMLYPLIWLWRRLHPTGGAPYNVARSTYSLKFYPPLPSTFPGESLEAANDRLGGMYKIHPELPKPANLISGPKGVHYLLGRKEGEWFREWEERIRMGTKMRYRGELQGGGEEEAGMGLDGY